MKYVVLQIKAPDDVCMEIPIIFPECLIHSTVAEAMKPALIDIFGADLEITVVSAATINSADLSLIRPTGSSSTLKLTSRPEDKSLITMSDYGSCIIS